MRSASETLSSTRERISGTVSAMRERASDVTDATRQQWERARGSLDYLVHEQPLALGAIGLAIGAVLGAAAPRTRVEEQMMGRASHNLGEKARQMGSEQLDKAEQAVKEVARPAQPQEHGAVAGSGIETAGSDETTGQGFLVVAVAVDSRGREASTPSEIPPRGWLDIARRVKEQIRRDRLSIIAAGVAFYGLLAIFPGLVALVATYGLFADPVQIERHVASLSAILPPEARS
jgi:hypothetical protein